MPVMLPKTGLGAGAGEAGRATCPPRGLEGSSESHRHGCRPNLRVRSCVVSHPGYLFPSSTSRKMLRAGCGQSLSLTVAFPSAMSLRKSVSARHSLSDQAASGTGGTGWLSLVSG